MKTKHPFSCDYCGTRKQASNNWCLRDLLLENFSIAKWNEAKAGVETHDGKPQFEHICSETCAAKALNKWFGKQGVVSVDS